VVRGPFNAIPFFLIDKIVASGNGFPVTSKAFWPAITSSQPIGIPVASKTL